ncbi:MAG: hypothetical protein H7Z10_15965 [Gemmatimonadaceae bacterium]|nr:hypothetical protein [Acetobacteraceae bacterium]
MTRWLMVAGALLATGCVTVPPGQMTRPVPVAIPAPSFGAPIRLVDPLTPDPLSPAQAEPVEPVTTTEAVTPVPPTTPAAAAPAPPPAPFVIPPRDPLQGFRPMRGQSRPAF